MLSLTHWGAQGDSRRLKSLNFYIPLSLCALVALLTPLFWYFLGRVGWVKPEIPTTVMIQYSQRDLARNRKSRIVRSFFQGESFSFKPAPFAVNLANVVLMEPSPSWTYLAVLRSIKEKPEEDEKYAVEVRPKFHSFSPFSPSIQISSPDFSDSIQSLTLPL